MDKKKTEEFKISAKEIIEKIEQIIKEGKARRIIVKNEEGKVIMDFSIPVAVPIAAVGLIFAPILAGLGVLVAFLTECVIIIEKEEEPKKE